MRLFLTSLLALAWFAAGQPAPAATGAAVHADKLVCKDKARTGTRFPAKMCRTRAQWEQITLQHRREASEMIDRPVQNRECTGATFGVPSAGIAPTSC
jgi:hypothetical protein